MNKCPELTTSIERLVLEQQLARDVSQQATYWALGVAHGASCWAFTLLESCGGTAVFAGAGRAEDAASLAEQAWREAVANSYQPQSALGRDLRRIRAELVASGEPLLDWADIEKDVSIRRGGQHDESDDTDLH